MFTEKDKNGQGYLYLCLPIQRVINCNVWIVRPYLGKKKERKLKIVNSNFYAIKPSGDCDYFVFRFCMWMLYFSPDDAVTQLSWPFNEHVLLNTALEGRINSLIA